MGLGPIEPRARKEQARAGPVLDGGHFVYESDGASASVQEVLFHRFGVPPAVIAEPEEWYAYHRFRHSTRPRGDDRVLVRFGASALSWRSFGSTCLYAKPDGTWARIRLSERRGVHRHGRGVAREA